MLCDAKSVVTISDPEILKLITQENVGIGQLFQRLNVLPKFELIQLGKTQEFFWREYTLKHTGITCHIHEFFPIPLYESSLQI